MDRTAGVTLLRVVHAEWTKLRSVPSTMWSLLSAAALIAGVGAAYALVRVTRPPHGAAALATFDPTAISLSGTSLAQLAVGVLGVLVITGEYATGTIRSTMAAVPARTPVLWGKAVALVLTTVLLCAPASVLAFVVGQSVLAREHLETTLSHPGVLRAVLGSALYLAVIGVLGLGLGALLRHTAGAVAALIGVLFIPQILLGFLPGDWSDQAYRYLPAPAGMAITAVQPDPLILSPWAGIGLLAGYAITLLGAAAWMLRRRDV